MQSNQVSLSCVFFGLAHLQIISVLGGIKIPRKCTIYVRDVNNS